PAEALREAQLQSITRLREQTKLALGEALAPVTLWAPFIAQQTGERAGSRPPIVKIGGYGWWNLIVPLFAMAGLLILSRVSLSNPPTEAVGVTFSGETQSRQAVSPARLVRRSPSDTLPPEITLLHDDILIGSGAECDVILRHPSIARQHARIQR